MFKACIGLNCARQIDFIDRRGCQLMEVPDDIYRHESYLEELLLDSNSIQELPPKLFRLTNLRKLTLSENDVMRLPPMIANFSRLLELDISKNCIEEIPSNLQFCRSLSYLDCSCNPLMRIPDCVANVTSLSQLFLNDVGLPALPREIGNLQNLVVLEARENLLRRVPLSIGELKKLERLDLGNNEIEALPSSIGFLQELTELWLDSNCLSLLPEELSNLRKLTVLDVTKNKLERLPSNFACLICLSDLHASENCIEVLPDDFGCLKSLTQLKLDLNHLITLPESIGEIPSLVEVFLFENMLEAVPPSLFSIPTLNMLNLDRNHLIEIPSNVGQCKSLHILSLRENDITFLPEEIGQLQKLRVLDVSGNRISSFPLTLSNLNLDALWISGSQLQPLVSLQQVPDPENPDRRVLSCQFLPQKGQYGSELDYGDGLSDDDYDEGGDLPRRRTKSLPAGGQLSVAFEPGTAGLPAADDSTGGKLVRFPTPFRKDLKNRHKKPKLDARPRTTVFRKGSMDDLALHAVDVPDEEPGSPIKHGLEQTTKDNSSVSQSVKSSSTADKGKASINGDLDGLPPPTLLSNLNKTQGVTNLSADYLGEDNKSSHTEENNEEKKPSGPQRTKLKTIEVIVELIKDPNRGLGFSIAGGKGSTPAYEDVDESIFVTRIIRGGAAEKDSRLRLGDKVLSVNNQDMVDATHMQAVTALRNSHKKCILKVSREVLIVLPDDVSIDDDSLEVEGGIASSTPAIIDRSLESLNTSTAVVTEESTGQRVEPITDSNNTEWRSEIQTQNGSVPPLDSSSEYSNRGERNVVGEAVLLDSDREINTTSDTGDSKVDINSDTTSDKEVVSNRTMALEDKRETESEVSLDIDDKLDLEEDRVSLKDGPVMVPEKESDRGDSGLEVSNFEETVVLDRSIPILGMSIVGGVDYSCKLFGCGNPGIYISKVTEGGAAAATGKLRIGDKIMRVNDVDMESATHEEAVMCLVSQEGNIELYIRHEPPPPGLQGVVITKGGNKLGVSIKGGGPESVGNPFDPADEGIFISKISKGGVAEMDGRLEVGQRILEVDGNSLLGASHVEAVHILRQTGDTVKLLVCDGYGLHSHGVARFLDKDLRTGSMELLEAANKGHVNVKRTHSIANSFMKKRDGVNKEESAAEFNRVLADLTKYQEVISTILPEKAVKEEDVEGINDENNVLEEISVVAEMNSEPVMYDIQLNEEITLEQISTNNNNESIQPVTTDDSKESIGYKKRENADEVARQRTEKQEELKSIISEVFCDLEEWEIMGKVSDVEDKVEEPIKEMETPQELVMSPPSASELSGSLSPINSNVKILTDELLEENPGNQEMEVKEGEDETGNSNGATNQEMEIGRDLEKPNIKEMGVAKELTIVPSPENIQQSRDHAHSVPPTPTRPPSQREWSVERPLSAQGRDDKSQVILRQKPTNFKAPEKLSFKDKLALHQKRVENVSKTVEDELKLKRRSWAPMGNAPFTSLSNTTSPMASPTHKLFSSISLTTPPTMRLIKMSPEREQQRLSRHTNATATPTDSLNKSSSLPLDNILDTNCQLLLSERSGSSSSIDNSDSPPSPTASDPPLTDASTPTSVTNENEDFEFPLPTTTTDSSKNYYNNDKHQHDIENISLLSNNQVD